MQPRRQLRTEKTNLKRTPEPTRIATLMVGAILFLCIAACNTEHGSSSTVVTDSSGVQIIVSTKPAWPEGLGWRLSGRRILEIGVIEGDPAFEFFEISGASRLTDGRIAVAEDGASEIRFYDSHGNHLYSTGRKGGGPGEFGSITSMSVTPEDTLVVLDSRNRRISYFDPAGTFKRSMPLHFLAEVGGFPTSMAPFDDGTYLIVVRTFFGFGGLGTGLTRDNIVYLRCDESGALLDTLAVRPGTELYSAVQGENRMGGLRPFGLSSQFAAHRNGFFHGSGGRYEIEEFNKDGTLRRSIRRPIPNMEVTDADVDGYKQNRIENAEDETQRQINETLVEAIPFPESFPAYRSLLVDAANNLWVGVFRKPGDDLPRWTVFDQAGRMRGEVQTPERFTIFQIGEDFLLGRWTDEFDVQHVVMYELLKG